MESYWQRQEENKRPGNVIETLRVASDLDTYPTLVILLRLFATIPISTATADRSFSNLKFIKNNLRSTTTESRLNGLAHLLINRDIKLNYNTIIDQFCGENNRRLKFTWTVASDWVAGGTTLPAVLLTPAGYFSKK